MTKSDIISAYNLRLMALIKLVFFVAITLIFFMFTPFVAKAEIQDTLDETETVVISDFYIDEIELGLTKDGLPKISFATEFSVKKSFDYIVYAEAINGSKQIEVVAGKGLSNKIINMPIDASGLADRENYRFVVYLYYNIEGIDLSVSAESPPYEYITKTGINGKNAPTKSIADDIAPNFDEDIQNPITQNGNEDTTSSTVSENSNKDMDQSTTDSTPTNYLKWSLIAGGISVMVLLGYKKITKVN